ncbi:MAG: ATP-binding cassette domain-containing protein [Bacteroidales bacterium]|nr:ATP-binding cassette domain-containing protein [Bacteroidales bacterium]MDD3664215.1 ATP-binding cassette domain-containing protein [Bacteroidales bacterium]
MQIEIINGGKRFNREWIFRGLTYTIETGRPVAILGSNGSGKSTLLQTLSTRSLLSEGEVIYKDGDKVIAPEERYKLAALASPYLELIEEYTLTEMVEFHLEHKTFMGNLTASEALSVMELKTSAGKPLRYFSSGMKQRVKLALAILSNTPVLLLDEPVSNLDHKAMQWYRQMMLAHAGERLVIVCSNHQPVEHDFCQQQITIEDYKPVSGKG